MRESPAALQLAEKVAAVVAIIAALVVLNGAWQNQHNWQNLSWRIAVAALLCALALMVETSALVALQRRRAHGEEAASVPDFLRPPGATMGAAVGDEIARYDSASAVSERH